MSDRSTGFFSSVGRFFTGGSTSAQNSTTKSSSNDIPPSSSSSSSPRSSNSNTSFLKDVMTLTTEVSPNKRNVKYLSPSALDSSFQKRNRTLNGLEIEVDPVADIFSSPSLNSQSRKRQLTEVDRSLISPSFRSEGAKRKQDFGNRSLFEPTLKTTIGGTSRLDSTWCGQFSASHSPASSVTNFSLISRNTATTNGSSTLSSSTKHLLKKLESASTPARDVQRMTMIRAGYTRPEKWATSSVSSGVSDGAPPLKKSTDNCQSRIQLLSKTMSAHKHDYWRDLTRRRSDPKRNDSDISIITTKTNGSAKSNELSSLFAVEKPTHYSRNELPAKKHQPVLKGSDGKSIGKNTFKFNEEDDLNSTVTETWLKNSEPLKLDAAPAKGFLGSLTFTFNTPVDVISSASTKKSEPVIIPKKVPEVESEKSDADETDSVKSASGESENESESDSESSHTSSTESSEESDAQVEKPKEKEDSRPQTSTDTISPAVSLLSSKNSSPKTNVVAPLPTSISASIPEKKTTTTTTPAASSTWSCDGCFTSWPESTNECGCCGTKKGGSAANEQPAQKTLVSNIATFATASKPPGVSFGFGAGSSSTGSSTAPPVSFGTSSTTGSLFGTSSTSKPAPVPNDPPAVIPTLPTVPKPAATSSSSSDRVAWDCPDCMVSNKSTDDKCPCCGHIKYKSAGDSGSSNVFGDRAFKPSAPASGGFSFGIGSSTATTTTLPSFGLSAKPTEPVAAAPAAPAPTAAPTTVPLFGTSSIAAPAAPLANLAPSTLAPAPIDPPKTDAVPSTTTSSQPSLFGSTSGISLFGTSQPAKPADPKPLSTFNPIPAAPKTVAQTPLVSTTTTEVPKTAASIFGSLSAPTSEAPKPSLFGAPSATTGNLFGSTVAAPAIPAVPEPPKQSIFGTSTTANMFGAPSSTLPEAPKLNTFGSSSTTSTEIPKFGAPSAAPLTFGVPSAPTQNAPAPNLFGNATTSLFGQSSSNMFGSSTDSSAASLFGNKPQTGTDSTDGGPSAKRGTLFSAPADSTTKPFGTFGNSGISSTTSTAAAPFGGAFGGNSFGSFGSQPSVAPTLSNSSSTSSLFNPAPVQSNESSMFSTTAVPNSFNFGSSTNSSNGVFMFGSNNAAPIPPPIPNSQPPAFAPFQSSAPIGGENAFAYQAPNGARKMAMARRRNANRK